MNSPVRQATHQQADQVRALQEQRALEYVKAMLPVLNLASFQHNRPLGAEEKLFWAKAMVKHGVTPDNFTLAMEHHLATSRWWPQPIDIAELVNGENSGNRPLLALNELVKQIEAHGYYREHTIEDPILLQTIEDLGGWEEVNMRCDDSESFRIGFLSAYRNNQKSTPVIGLSNQRAIEYEDTSSQMTFLPPGQ